mmetsp:Transcript_46315/g.97326  ORF Transcript_46315/g.97326 Transcript_46315/m.97326 type:complete len:217 (-) Transcript_46315:583-1233(-)
MFVLALFFFTASVFSFSVSSSLRFVCSNRALARAIFSACTLASSTPMRYSIPGRGAGRNVGALAAGAEISTTTAFSGKDAGMEGALFFGWNGGADTDKGEWYPKPDLAFGSKERAVADRGVRHWFSCCLDSFGGSIFAFVHGGRIDVDSIGKVWAVFISRRTLFGNHEQSCDGFFSAAAMSNDSGLHNSLATLVGDATRFFIVPSNFVLSPSSSVL